ncbi:MAG: hypothetical protein WCK47_09065 [bacterium]|nr:hypothetical protein [Candidatus Sumerlaeota bacterium]
MKNALLAMLVLYAGISYAQIQNPGFETGSATGGYPPWVVTNISGSPALVDGSDKPHTGLQALRFFSTDPFEVQVSQAITGVAAGVYHLKVFFNMPYGGDATTFTLYADGGLGEETASALSTYDSYRSLLCSNIVVTAAGNLMVGIRMAKASGATGTSVYVDDFSLIPAPTGLQNYSFEAGNATNGWDYWNVCVTGGIGFPENASGMAHTGTNSARFYTAQGAPFSGVISQGLNGVPPGRYNVKMYYHRPWGGDPITFRLRTNGGAGEKSIETLNDSNNAWRSLMLQNVEVTASGFFDIFIECFTSGDQGTSIYVDDVSITNVDSFTGLQNPGFEAGNQEDGWDFWSTSVQKGIAFEESGTGSPHSGSNSCRFYNNTLGSKETVNQEIVGLTPGSYDVAAWMGHIYTGNCDFKIRAQGNASEVSGTFTPPDNAYHNYGISGVSVGSDGLLKVWLEATATSGDVSTFFDDVTVLPTSAVESWSLY